MFLCRYCEKLIVVVLHCRNNDEMTFVTTLPVTIKLQ
jgi:hypothetical protein